MSRYWTSILLTLVAIPALIAQGLAPFVSNTDRYMVFDHGRFVEVDGRKPASQTLADGRLWFVDQQGTLKCYSEGQVDRIDTLGATLRGGGRYVIYEKGGKLMSAKPTGSVMLTEHHAASSVEDSLVVWHDTELNELDVAWRGKVFTMARIDRGSREPQWATGSNTVVFYDRGRHTIFLFYRGEVLTLCDSSDVGKVATGGDMVSYWDDSDDTFKAFDHGRTVVLEQFDPVSFKVGDGVIAYVDHGTRFNVYDGSTSQRVLDHPPTIHWVRDSVVVFIDRGKFMTYHDGQIHVIEDFVPEQWEVSGATIHYLDLDRRIRSYHVGERTAISKEARVAHFDLFGDAVVYRDQQGLTTVWWRGKRYTY